MILSFVAPDMHTSLEEYLSDKMRWTLESTRRIESEQSIESIQQDGQFLTFLFQSPSAALESALDLLTIHQHHFNIGVGYGRGYLFDHFQSLDLIRMKAVLAYGNTAELQVSPSVYSATEIPYGVGGFQCSPSLAQKVGMNYWILKDYRSELE